MKIQINIVKGKYGKGNHRGSFTLSNGQIIHFTIDEENLAKMDYNEVLSEKTISNGQTIYQGIFESVY